MLDRRTKIRPRASWALIGAMTGATLALAGCGESPAPPGPGANPAPAALLEPEASQPSAKPPPEPAPSPAPIKTGHRPGDTWEYRFEIPGQDFPPVTEVSSIVKLDTEKVLLRKIWSRTGAPAETADVEVRLAAGDLWTPDPAMVLKLREEEVVLGATRLKAHVYRTRPEHGEAVEYWYCPELPLLPVLRMDMGAGGRGAITRFEPGQ